jgi:hypothetical protein
MEFTTFAGETSETGGPTRRRTEDRRHKKEERDSPVGAAFPPGRRPYGPEASREITALTT